MTISVTPGSDRPSGSPIPNIFRERFLRAIESGEHAPMIRRIESVLELTPRVGQTFASYFNQVYGHLIYSYPFEYIFKNEITNRLFLARHNIARSTLLSEMRVGRQRVDVVIINGTSTAYEIKTEFDRLDRIRSQTDRYLDIFDRVYVVCPPALSARVLAAVDARVGVMEFWPDGSISVARKHARNVEHVRPDAIFECFRMLEYTDVIRQEFGYVPIVGNVHLYRACKEMFCTLGPVQAHKHLVRVLRTRALDDKDQSVVPALPYALRHLYYDLPRKRRAHLLSATLLARTVL